MSFTPRHYEEIVEDLLTTLTGGTVRETVDLAQDGDPLLLNKLRNRPIKRVSHLEAYFTDEEGETRRHRYASSDFELVNGDGGKDQPDRIHILEGARPPQVGDAFTVNYYPAQTKPVPLTDIQPGSVIRTILETFAREMAVTHLQMDFVYQSAFLETATGKSLDRVVALLGLKRFPGGYPQVQLRFFRRAQTPGQITVPAGTAVTDADGARYQTLQTLTLEPFESSRDILAAGFTKGTTVAEANQLTFPETVIAGIERVSNPDPAYQLTQPESDGDLRERARQAMLAGVGGTIEALLGGVRAVEGVKTVGYTEQPNGLPGEIRLDIVYSEESDKVKTAVRKRIDALRPAGIVVLVNDDTQEVSIRLAVDLTLAGSGLAEEALKTLMGQVETQLTDYFHNLAPQSKVRQAQLSALLLQDARLVDGKVMVHDGEGQELSAPVLKSNEIFKVLEVTFQNVEAESGESLTGILTVGAHLPAILEQGFTAEEVQASLDKAFGNYLTQASKQGALSVQTLLNALRDDQRYALQSSLLILTIETQNGQFIQLGEGLGEYAIDANQSLKKGQLTFDFEAEGA